MLSFFLVGSTVAEKFQYLVKKLDSATSKKIRIGVGGL